jgi:hypothetical protein
MGQSEATDGGSHVWEGRRSLVAELPSVRCAAYPDGVENDENDGTRSGCHLDTAIRNGV